MPFSAIPVVAGDDMVDLATYLELMGAWNERRLALGEAAITDPAAGDEAFDWNANYGIRAMQNWVETNCVNFIVSHDAGSARAGGHYDEETAIPFYDLTSFRSSATLNASGFTRTAAPTYGKAEVGDIVLKEHFNELRLAFKALVWTQKNAAFTNNSENNEQIGDSGGGHATWNAAYAAALAAYNGASPTADAVVNPYAREQAQTDGSTFQCVLERAYMYAAYSAIPTHVSHALDAYQYSEVHQINSGSGNNIYFAHGDGPPFEQAKYKLHQTFAIANTNARTTTKIGSIAAAPNQGPAPVVLTSGRQYGWEATPGTGSAFTFGVIRWNVAGGFSYV
jgi:hypothetical protein